VAIIREYGLHALTNMSFYQHVVVAALTLCSLEIPAHFTV
jgi:hypothetical protein